MLVEAIYCSVYFFLKLGLFHQQRFQFFSSFGSMEHCSFGFILGQLIDFP